MRERVFTGFILSCFAVIACGLFYTQVARYDLYKKLSENNRIRLIPLEAPRGKIFDRSGRLLVTNRIAFDVLLIFHEVKNQTKIIETLGDILGIDKNRIKKTIEEKARRNPFIPVKIVEDIEKEKAIQVEEARLDLPGVIVATRPLRNYLYKDMLSHVTGYPGEISKIELEKYKTYGYRMLDLVGKDGIERSYNDYLRGADGGLQTEVDSKGRQLEVLAIKEPRPGRNLYLSLDLELQKVCDFLLADNKGAIVAMNPNTGAILALVSHSDFDPNIFVSANNKKEITDLLGDTHAFPLLDRAISCAYPPGSIFKIVIATGVLEQGLFNDKKMLSCAGSFLVGNRLFHCWKEEGHGAQTIVEAIKNSCNVFFYQLGLRLGAERISEYAVMLGFGRLTGIDLPGETSGFIPSPEWKRKKLKEPWFDGETANYAIGQGYLLVTPIQVAHMTGAVANGGKLVKPFCVERVENIKMHHEKKEELRLKKETLEILKEGLREVVNAPHGTGFYAKSKNIVIAGKTGTAQNPKGESHAWFTGFAPYDDPKICVVVFIEHGGKGGMKPARFAKNIIEEAQRLRLL